MKMQRIQVFGIVLGLLAAGAAVFQALSRNINSGDGAPGGRPEVIWYDQRTSAYAQNDHGTGVYEALLHFREPKSR